MNIKSFLRQSAADAIAFLYQTRIPGEDILVDKTKPGFTGDFTIQVFPLTKTLKKSPDVIGKETGEYLKANNPSIQEYNLIKGFLNLSISPGWLHEYFAANALSFHKRGGVEGAGNKTILVEYASPNTNKPLHLGHIRNILLGYSVSKILEAAGYKVLKTNLINDRGVHICKSMLAWQRWGDGETPESSGIKGDKLVGNYYVRFDRELKKEKEAMIQQGMSAEDADLKAPLNAEAHEMLRKWEKGDPETVSLWKTMNAWVYKGFDVTYKRLGADFDDIWYESETYLTGKEIVGEGQRGGVFFRKEDGSVWVDLTADGLDQKLLLRGDGTSVYITQDIGTACLRYEKFRMDKLIYVVGNEQDYHFKVLRLILQKLNKNWASGIFHLSYGMVDLPSGKMKSREGTVVDADDLMDEMAASAKKISLELGKASDMNEDERTLLYETLGMGALKYFILKVDPQKRMLFDPAESIDFNGNTGPFIQYTYARISSVLGKNEAKAFRTGNYPYPAAMEEKEKVLIFLLDRYGEELIDAAARYSPALMANYAYEVAKAYNQFYHEHSILSAGNPSLSSFRLTLSATTASVLHTAMNLLGISMPERM